MTRSRSPDRLTPEHLEALVPSLRRYARALLRDATLADDLVQDTLERAWDKQARFESGTDLRAWMFAIMHNLFIGQVRRSDPLRGADDDQALAVRAAPADGDPIAVLEITRLVDRLPDGQRAVLLLVAVEELSYAEAARALGVPIGTIMSRLGRAREKLRAWLDAGSTPEPTRATSLRMVK